MAFTKPKSNTMSVMLQTFHLKTFLTIVNIQYPLYNQHLTAEFSS